MAVTGEIVLPSSAEGVSYEGCDIVTTLDIFKLSGSKFETIVLNNGTVQPVFLMDENDNVYMMARISDVNSGHVKLDERSTALALATMHPLLAPLRGEDFNKIVSMLTSSDKFDAFVQEVAAAIAVKRNIFDEDNQELLLAFNELLESIAEKVNENVDYNGTLEDITDSALPATRALYESPKVYPLYADISGNVLTLRNVGLTPSYYGEVYEANGSTTPFSVPSRSDYGGMDLFKENLDEFMMGDPRTFTFTDDGNYRFYLSRMSDAAIADFWLRLANAVLTSVGLELGNDAIQEVGNMISRAMINANSGVNDTVTDPMEWVGIAYGAVLEWAQQDYWETIGKGGIIRIGKVLAGSLDFYSKIKGIFNASMRLAHMLSAPEEIRFCLCYKEGGRVMPCSKSTLFVVGGDEQVGYENQRLLLPLKVYVQTLDEDGNEIKSNEYCRVKFEVVSGGGRVESETVSADHNNEAATYWTLGEGDEQSVKAVAVDLVTGGEISEPVYFTATVSSAQITIRLDWSKHSCNTDIDLHVVDPNGEKIYYRHMYSASGGYLDRDDVVGPGPEHIRWSDAPAGVYKIYVHYYPNDAPDKSVTRYTVSVTTDETEYQPKSGSIAYDQYRRIRGNSIGCSSRAD